MFCPLASLLKHEALDGKELTTFWTLQISVAVVLEFCSFRTAENPFFTFYNDNLIAIWTTNLFHLSPPFIATK